MVVLTYYDTDTPVALGDVVEIKRFLRRSLRGRVSYFPGQSSPHPEMRIGDVDSWAIDVDDGSRRVWPYLPDQLQPPRWVRFVSRSPDDYKGLEPDQPSGLLIGTEPESFADDD